jgi:hypothetical protein
MNLLRFLLPVLFLFAFSSMASTSTPNVKFNAKGWNKHRNAITAAAHRTNQPVDDLAAFASIETTMGLSKDRKGLFQFVDRTWKDQIRRNGKKYGLRIGTPQTNARANALMAGEYMRENRQYLERVLGRPVDLSEIYMAHMLGTYGAEKMLKASNKKLAKNIVRPGGNKPFFYSKGRPLTVGEFKSRMSTFVERHASTYRVSAVAYMDQRYSTETQLAMR